MKPPGPLARIYLGLVAFSLAGTLLSRTTGLEPGPIAPIASILTILTGTAAVFGPALFERRAGSAVIAALVLGATVELVGLETGFPFGEYTYTANWQPTITVMGNAFPVLLPFAWLLVTGAAYLVAHRLVGRSYGTAPLAAVIATAVDVPMEWTMAGSLRYWVWREQGPLPGGAPVANVFGWLGTSLLAGMLFHLGGVERSAGKNGDDASAVLLGHLVLMVGLGLIPVASS